MITETREWTKDGMKTKSVTGGKMFSSGVVDKNNKLIYNKDFVRFSTGVGYVDALELKVVFREGSFGFVSIKQATKEVIFISFYAFEQNLKMNGCDKPLSLVVEVYSNEFKMNKEL